MIYGYIRPISRSEISKDIITDLSNEIIEKYKDIEVINEDFNNDFYSLSNLIDNLKSNDIVVVNGLERIGRDMEEVVRNISYIIEHNAEIHILNYCNIKKDNYIEIIKIINMTEYAKEQMYKERRSLSTINSKLNSEKKQGKPRKNLDSVKVFNLLNNHTQQEVAEILGVSRSTITRFLRKEK